MLMQFHMQRLLSTQHSKLFEHAWAFSHFSRHKIYALHHRQAAVRPAGRRKYPPVWPGMKCRRQKAFHDTPLERGPLPAAPSLTKTPLGGGEVCVAHISSNYGVVMYINKTCRDRYQCLQLLSRDASLHQCSQCRACCHGGCHCAACDERWREWHL